MQTVELIICNLCEECSNKRVSEWVEFNVSLDNTTSHFGDKYNYKINSDI